MANKRVIEAVGDSLAEARERLIAQVPEHFRLRSEQILSDGKPKTHTAACATIDEALAKARAEIPAGAQIVDQKIVSNPASRTLLVEGLDEAEARREVLIKTGEFEILRDLRLVEAGRKGFLGIGKKPNKYEAGVFQQAIVETTCQRKAMISAEIVEKVSSAQIDALADPIRSYLTNFSAEVIELNYMFHAPSAQFVFAVRNNTRQLDDRIMRSARELDEALLLNGSLLRLVNELAAALGRVRGIDPDLSRTQGEFPQIQYLLAQVAGLGLLPLRDHGGLNDSSYR